MSCFSISHVCQSALSPSPALHPLPTQLHPFIKEPMGTRKLIVRPGIFAPCCRADLLTPVSLPSAHHSSSRPSSAHPEWMQFLWIGQCAVNSVDSATGGFILEMSQTTSEACCCWMKSSGVPTGPCKGWAHVQNALRLIIKVSLEDIWSLFAVSLCSTQKCCNVFIFVLSCCWSSWLIMSWLHLLDIIRGKNTLNLYLTSIPLTAPFFLVNLQFLWSDWSGSIMNILMIPCVDMS